MCFFDKIPDELSNLSSNGLAIGAGDFTDQAVEIGSNYRNDWQSTYFENDWMTQDPVVMHGLSTAGITPWKSMQLKRSTVMNAAQDYGIKNGFVASSIICGNHCIAGISTTASTSKIAQDHAMVLLTELHFDFLAAKATKLPDHYKDLVYLVANGYMAKQISDIYDISIDTVKQRKLAIQKSIGVNNFTAVVNICARAGLTFHRINWQHP